jgi:hypothetical protein
MARTTFSSDNLRKLLRLNFTNFSEIDYMVFGIRGATPVSANFDTFKIAHQIEKTDVDYTVAHCTIGIWKPVENTIALFPASTVPNLKYMKEQLAAGTALAVANAMMTGYYSYYEKGFHFPSEGNAHEALRLATNIALRRSMNDLVFDNQDPIEVGNPNDNIHAAYCTDVNGAYSSAGCQVIIGQPKCKNRGANSQHTGFWKKFHDIIYNDTTQKRFDYALFRYADAEIVASQGANLMQARLRFGSKGNIVLQLQEKLEEKGFFTTNKDGDFGRNTLRAVINYQTATFGIAEADGVVGNGTATSLGLTLPMI